MAAERPHAGRPAVFLDRDGVLNVDTGYVFRVSDLALMPGVAEAVVELKRRGFVLLVVSNQSGVARGMFGEAEVHTFNAALDAALVAAAGVGLDGYYVCPHLPNAKVAAYRQDCDCRKPKTGLVERAAREHDIDLARSYLVGDKPDDIACAVASRVKGIQAIATGYPRHPAALAHVQTLRDALPILTP